MVNNTRSGSLRYRRSPEEDWVIAAPGSPMFSTVTMMATEYFDGSNWCLILESDPDEAAPLPTIED